MADWCEIPTRIRSGKNVCVDFMLVTFTRDTHHVCFGFFSSIVLIVLMLNNLSLLQVCFSLCSLRKVLTKKVQRVVEKNLAFFL